MAELESRERNVESNKESTKLLGGITGKGFMPGQSGNPGGRPKSRLFSEAYKRILEDEGADEYARVVADDARTAPKASERLAAAQEMADRTEGKPTQSHRVEASLDAATAQRLAELAEKLLGVP